MYEYIKGKIEYISDDYLIIENNGIGYKIFTSSNTLNNINFDELQNKVFTYLHVREDDLTLYGFISKEELDIFKLLLTVSKIGPKVGLSILSTISPRQLAYSIANEDVNLLSKAPGVGSKTAKRIILELKDKFKSNLETINEKNYINRSNNIDDAITALLALGYTKNEINKVFVNKNLENYSIEDIIKIALTELSK